MSQGTEALLGVTRVLTALGKQYPGAAPIIAQINDLLPKVGMAIMEHQTPGEPQAPPTNG